MPLPTQILCRSPQKQVNSVETALKRYLCKTGHLAVLAGALNREFSGTENMGGNRQLCCKNDDEELVGMRVGGQKKETRWKLHRLPVGFCKPVPGCSL